jgi:hypothetical protein
MAHRSRHRTFHGPRWITPQLQTTHGPFGLSLSKPGPGASKPFDKLGGNGPGFKKSAPGIGPQTKNHHYF